MFLVFHNSNVSRLGQSGAWYMTNFPIYYPKVPKYISRWGFWCSSKGTPWFTTTLHFVIKDISCFPHDLKNRWLTWLEVLWSGIDMKSNPPIRIHMRKICKCHSHTYIYIFKWSQPILDGYSRGGVFIPRHSNWCGVKRGIIWGITYVGAATHFFMSWYGGIWWTCHVCA